MQFKGQLLLPDEPGPGLRVNLDVAEHHLAVESDGGGLGAWPLETVAVKRLQGDIFALTVAGESLRFVADDTIAFNYSGVPTIERVSRRPKSRSSFRSMLDWVWGREDPAPADAEESTSSEATGPASPDQVTMPGMPEEVTEASAYTVAEIPDEIDTTPSIEIDEAAEVVDQMTEEDADDALEVFQGIDIPFVEIDEVAEVAEDPIEPSPPVLAESAPFLESLADSEGCPAIRSDGRRCESPILTSSGYCYPHDPKRALADKYQSAQEARARLRRQSTARLNRIYARLDKALRQVERGDLDPETAMAMAQLARTMCAILDIDDPPTGIINRP